MGKGNTDTRVVLVVGKKNAGKTAYLRWIARRAQERGLSVAGFLSVGEMSGGKKHRYYLHNLQTEERHLLASREHSPSGTENVGDYFFEPTTFHRAEQAYREALAADLIIFDELGPLELRGRGLFAAFTFLLKNYHGTLFISVRPRLLLEAKKLLHV